MVAPTRSRASPLHAGFTQCDVTVRTTMSPVRSHARVQWDTHEEQLKIEQTNETVLRQRAH
jgi:hypothetical protein